MGSLDAVGKLTVLGVVFRGGARVERGDMTGGDLLAFALYAAYAALGLAGLARVALGDEKSDKLYDRLMTIDPARSGYYRDVIARGVL